MPEPTQLPKPPQRITYTHLLRVEGVNHDQFIFDTTDLATIRGGGLLLLAAASRVLDVAKQYNPNATAVAISTGASSALIALSLAGTAEASEATLNNLEQQIGLDFQSDANFKHATFVVSTIKSSGPNSFAFDREAILAKNRHAQMTALSLRTPSSQATEVCVLDRIRPADPETQGLTPGPLSVSVHQRREFGRLQKQSFYANEIADINPDLSAAIKYQKWPFAQDFDQIASKAPSRTLDHKLALFYADGNSFGTHQRAASANLLNDWDCAIKAHRRTLLAKILEAYADVGCDAHDRRDGNPIRFETLLWGGDEMIFVMPAWRGIEFTEQFFDLTKDWTFNETKLTHAVGLVFCHDNAPIHAVRKLAQTLAESAKETTARKGNSINYVVLESFDHVGNAWPDYLRRVYNGKLCETNRCLTADKFQEVVIELRTLTEHLPRSRLAPYLQALIADNASTDTVRTAAERRDEDLDDATKESAKKLTDLRDSCPIAGWSHAADLWDYVKTTEGAQL